MNETNLKKFNEERKKILDKSNGIITKAYVVYRNIQKKEKLDVQVKLLDLEERLNKEESGVKA